MVGIGTQVEKIGGGGYAMIPKIRVQGFKSSGSSKLLIKLGDNVSYSKHDEQYTLYRT